jgi:hypothetical protein
VAVRNSGLYGLSFVLATGGAAAALHAPTSCMVGPSPRKGGKTTAYFSHTLGHVGGMRWVASVHQSAAMQRLRPSDLLTRDADVPMPFGVAVPASGFPCPVRAGWGSGMHHLDVDSIWGFGPRYEEI